MLFVHLFTNWRIQYYFVVANAITRRCLLLMMISLAGCSDNATNLEKLDVFEVDVITEENTVLQEESNESLSINLIGLRNPFQKHLTKQVSKKRVSTKQVSTKQVNTKQVNTKILAVNRKKLRDNSRTQEPLEQYKLDQLSMVGTLSMHNTQWALIKINDEAIKDKKNISPIIKVKKGNYIGQNQGKITDISNNAVTLIDADDTSTFIAISD